MRNRIWDKYIVIQCGFNVNQVLSLLVLSATFIYTVIQIADKVANKKKK